MQGIRKAHQIVWASNGKGSRHERC